MSSDCQSWLRFANLQLPARVAHTMLERFGTPDRMFASDVAAFDGLPGLSGRQAARLLDPAYLPSAEQLAYVERKSVRVMGFDDPDYPVRLRDISDPPVVLFARGALLEKDRFAVGLVGTRRASPYGRSVTSKLARDLSSAGLTVVSGGAMGIDTSAHRGAVEARGRTIAVLGCGLDVPYPRENQALFDQIEAEGLGAVISEFPIGATPEPWRFPMRNRIISGLSMGVVVIEAGDQSGALLTASMAAEQGRDVLAVPGNVDRPYSRGTNALIRDGAALVESAQDVMRALGMLVLEPPNGAVPAPPSGALSTVQQTIVSALSLTPKHIDSLAAEVKLPTSQLNVEMTMLELSGQVRRLPGSCYIRAL